MRVYYFHSTLGHGYALSTDDKGGHLPVGLGPWVLERPVDLDDWKGPPEIMRDLMSNGVYISDAEIPAGTT